MSSMLKSRIQVKITQEEVKELPEKEDENSNASGFQTCNGSLTDDL